MPGRLGKMSPMYNQLTPGNEQTKSICSMKFERTLHYNEKETI